MVSLNNRGLGWPKLSAIDVILCVFVLVLVCYAATQLALQLHQERIQVM